MVDIFSSSPFYTTYVKQPTTADRPGDFFRGNGKLWPYFSHALGAIDGSHIHIAPPLWRQMSFRNRKGFLSQNGLFCCTFNLLFSYVLAGWEGSAADARVYQSAIDAKSLVIPMGSYYLADAGFPHCDQLLVPFCGIRYHLAEWGRVAVR